MTRRQSLLLMLTAAVTAIFFVVAANQHANRQHATRSTIEPSTTAAINQGPSIFNSSDWFPNIPRFKQSPSDRDALPASSPPQVNIEIAPDVLQAAQRTRAALELGDGDTLTFQKKDGTHYLFTGSSAEGGGADVIFDSSETGSSKPLILQDYPNCHDSTFSDIPLGLVDKCYDAFQIEPVDRAPYFGR
jgi:hypothetical protein